MTETKPKPGRKPKEAGKKIIKIANTDVVIGEIYELTHKFDASAPDGMQTIRATKFPMKNVAEKKAIFYDETRRAFDTGFYKDSFCNKSISRIENPEEMVRIYNEFVRVPYEKAMNVDCSETNYEFWDKYKYEAKVNKSFNTNDPVALFDLFHILKQGTACNEGEKNPELQKARYNVRSIQENKNLEDEKIERKATAVHTVYLLLEADREKLDTISEYLNLINPRGMEAKVLRNNYLRLFDEPTKGAEFQKRFLDASEKYNSEDGSLEMKYFGKINELFRAGQLVKKAGSIYDKRDNFLGNTPKEISQKAVADKEFRVKVDEVIEENQ